MGRQGAEATEYACLIRVMLPQASLAIDLSEFSTQGKRLLKTQQGSPGNGAPLPFLLMLQ